MVTRSLSLSFWLIAFFLSFTFLPAYQNEMMVGAISLLLIAVFMRCFSGLYAGSWFFPKEKTLIVLGLFWLVALGSVFWSQIFWISATQFWVFSCLPLSALFFLGGQRDVALKAVLVVLSVFAVFAFYQYYMLPEMLYKGRVQWPLKNPNSLGAVFSIGAFLGLGWALKAKSRWALVCLTLMIIGLITTGSRGALGAFALGLVFLFVAVKPVIDWKKAGGLVFALIGLALVMTYSGDRPDNMALVSTVKTVMGEHSLLWSRGELWSSTWQIIKEHPFLGTGIGTFPQFYEQYRSSIDSSAGFMAHNDPLQFWSEMGVLSIVLFYVFVVLMCARTWRFFKATSDVSKRLDVMVPFVALGAMVLHSHVSFNLHIVPILFLSGLCFAMWLRGVSELDVEIKRPIFISIGRGEAGLVVLGFLLFLTIVPPFLSNYYMVQAGRSDRYANVEAFVYNMNQANKWSFGLSAQPYLIAAPIQITMLEHDIDILMSKERSVRIQEIETLLNKAESLNPRAVGVYYNRALLAQLLTKDDPDYGDVDKNLERALFYKPRHVPSRLWLVDRMEARGEIDEAITLLRAGLRWCGRQKEASQCYGKMAVLLTQSGSVLEAEEMLRRSRASMNRR